MSACPNSRAIWRDDELNEHFLQLTTVLKAGEKFWRHHAFKYLQLPWEEEFPELSKKLRSFSLADAEQLATNDDELLNFLSSHYPLFSRIKDACSVGQFGVETLPDIEPRDIPGRKWQQIRHFAPCIPTNDFSLLEWCSGKSHLGRTVAKERGCTTIALEYSADLIDAGKHLVARDRVGLDFYYADALTEQAADAVQKNQNAIALHACGDLHTQLLRLCAQKKTATITLAPCCYQLMQDETRYLLSEAAKASGLYLQRDDLRTAVQGSVTISPRENQRRQRLQAWRLGFDLLQRDVRGSDEYLQTPSLSVIALKDGFPNFCRKMAALRHIELPAFADFTYHEREGETRLREVTALDLPRIAFRRVLELWLVLDRALFLREHGYRVEVATFCPRMLTPRNIVIRASAGVI